MGGSGEVIGVVDAKLNDLGFLVTSGSLPQNVNYAIKAKVVHEFLANHPELPELLKSAYRLLAND